MRAVPHLTFHPDRSMAHAAHIQTVLEELREREGRSADPDDSAASSPAAVRPSTNPSPPDERESR
jgi:hypothetical protein